MWPLYRLLYYERGNRAMHSEVVPYNTSNKKQNTNILKFIDKEQSKILQQISKNILDGNIPLTSKEFHDLYHHKIFLRKLRSGKFLKKY